MADGASCGSTQSLGKSNHTRSISLPNPLRLIQLAELPRYSYDDAHNVQESDEHQDRPRNFLDNLLAIGQAAVDAANLQDPNSEDEESNYGTQETMQSGEGNLGSSPNNPEDPSSTKDGLSSEMCEEHLVLQTDPDSVSNYRLTCPVCLENYYRPHSCVPCKHIFCEPCLCRMRKADLNSITKCPLCREKIKKCVFDSALSSSAASTFPEIYQARHKHEKKQKHKLPPLPGIPITADKYAKNMLATWSAVCAVVLLMMFVFAVFASLVSFILWYTLEVMLDVVGELLIEVSDFFSFSWQALIILYIEGKVPQEIKDILSGSAGRISSTLNRLVNRTKAFFTDGEVPPPPVTMYVSYEQDKLNSTSQILTKVTQVNVANYVFLAGLFTYVLYRIARYFQNGNNGDAAPEANRLQ